MCVADRPLFLIGPTHVGKSHHGRRLSAHLDCPFIDLDSQIEEKAGVDIATIFDFEGEEGFRLREHKALVEIDPHALSVVSTGAGIVLWQDNREFLQHGWVIYLQAPMALLLSRVQKKTNRPLFQGKNPQQVLEKMNRIRTPLYEQCADFTVKIQHRQNTDKVLMNIVSTFPSFPS